MQKLNFFKNCPWDFVKNIENVTNNYLLWVSIGTFKHFIIFKWQSNSVITPPLIKFYPKRERGKERKKMWKGDFLCVGTVLEFTNYQNKLLLLVVTKY